jgi:hypothetical protein
MQPRCVAKKANGHAAATRSHRLGGNRGAAFAGTILPLSTSSRTQEVLPLLEPPPQGFDKPLIPLLGFCLSRFPGIGRPRSIPATASGCEGANAAANVYLPPELLQQIADLATRKKLSQSAIIEAAATSFLTELSPFLWLPIARESLRLCYLRRSHFRGQLISKLDCPLCAVRGCQV